MHPRPIVPLAPTPSGATQLELSTRRQALEVVAWLGSFKARTLARHNLVEPLLRTLCPLCTEPMIAQSRYDDDDDDRASSGANAEERLGLSGLAAQAVDSLAMNLPSKAVLPVCLAFASESLASPCPRLRRAACAVTAVIMEGCCEALRPRAADLAPALAARLSDPAPGVRGAAAFALGQMGEFLLPECLELHGVVLPQLLQAVRDPVAAVQARGRRKEMREDIARVPGRISYAAHPPGRTLLRRRLTLPFPPIISLSAYRYFNQIRSVSCTPSTCGCPSSKTTWCRTFRPCSTFWFRSSRGGPRTSSSTSCPRPPPPPPPRATRSARSFLRLSPSSRRASFTLTTTI